MSIVGVGRNFILLQSVSTGYRWRGERKIGGKNLFRDPVIQDFIMHMQPFLVTYSEGNHNELDYL